MKLHWPVALVVHVPVVVTADALDAFDPDDSDGIADALAMPSFDREIVDLKPGFERRSFRNMTPGVEAGMLATLIVGAVRTAASFTSDPARILALLNERLCGRGFVTCLALRVEADGTDAGQ